MSDEERNHIGELIIGAGILPMFSSGNKHISLQILKALYKGGIRVVEFTNRPADALGVFRELKKHAASEMAGLILGAGTILNTQQAEAFASEGADFIVAPVTDESVGAFCRSHDLFWCPGAATPTEILHAHHLGAGMIKVFPAEQLGGPNYIRAILAPCPWLRLMPTGGIRPDREYLQSWFEAGASAVGISSSLFTPEIISSGAYEKITVTLSHLLQEVAVIKNQLKK
jgi:2-dehydro-3-deoxyphosphogluconate aldolase/(4S)-4-hydroxy-2-oxoglutarate aldolase